MRILVLSDSHKHISNLVEAISNEPTAEIVYFLGDGTYEMDEVKEIFKEKMFIVVRGNCDFMDTVPLCDIRSVDTCKIYASHGATENVKLSFVGIKNEANYEKFLELIRSFHEQNKIIATICVGALPLGKSGVLNGKKATTYHLRDGYRQKQLAEFGVNIINERIVVDGNE